MDLKSFSEFLRKQRNEAAALTDDKGGVELSKKKPIISADGDTGPSGTKSPKPPKAVTKGKGWKNFEAAQVSDGGNGTEPAPYSAPGTDPGLENADGKEGRANPLGDKGEKDLIYNPKTADQRLKINVGKTKTESFLDETKGLNSEKYIEFVLRKTNGKAVQQIIETVNLVKENEGLIEALVREMKRQGAFDKLVETILDQPETYKEFAINLADENKGKEISRNLAKAINEITAPPEGDNDEELTPPSKKMPRNDDSIGPRGQPVKPEMNARKKQYVMMRPEHHLIEALANYKALRATMKRVID